MDYSNIHDPKVMQAVAALLSEAVTAEGGMESLAAAVAPPIELAIAERNIVPLALTEHVLPVGEEAKYQKRKSVQAHFVAVGGQVRRQEVNDDDDVTFPIFRVHSAPEVDVSDLKHGNIGKITDMQVEAAEEIRKKLNKRCMDLLSAAVPAGNIIPCVNAGADLTKSAFSQAVGMINDLELVPRFIFIRGQRMVDLNEWDLDNETKRDLLIKGVAKRLAGAGVANPASMNANEVIIIPDKEIGKYAIRTKIAVDAQKGGFKVKFLTWHEAAMGITRPDLVFKIAISSS